MKVTKEISKLENSAVKLTATIAKEDVVSGYNKNISKYAKNVQLPGFRKGHVPVKVLEQKYGDSLKQEVLADLIDESLNQIFAEEEICLFVKVSHGTDQDSRMNIAFCLRRF